MPCQINVLKRRNPAKCEQPKEVSKFYVGKFSCFTILELHPHAVREGSAKAQEVIGMVTGAGPGAMPQGGGWHVDAGPGRSEDLCSCFLSLLLTISVLLFK